MAILTASLLMPSSLWSFQAKRRRTKRRRRRRRRRKRPATRQPTQRRPTRKLSELGASCEPQVQLAAGFLARCTGNPPPAVFARAGHKPAQLPPNPPEGFKPAPALRGCLHIACIRSACSGLAQGMLTDRAAPGAAPGVLRISRKLRSRQRRSLANPALGLIQYAHACQKWRLRVC